MAALKFLLIILIVSCTSIECESLRDIHIRIEAINNRSINLYKINKRFSSSNIGLQEQLLYPRTDKHKLSELASQWREYYTCTARSLHKISRATRQLPSTMLAVYEGAVVRLECSICIAPGESQLVVWMCAESLKNLTFTEVSQNGRLSQQDGDLIIHNVVEEDAGVYQCRLGDSAGGIVILEIVDENNEYDTVKPSSSQGPYASPSHKLDNKLLLFTSWHPWSECSVCGEVGRERRFGMCYVKLITNRSESFEKLADDVTPLNNRVIQLFHVFPNGIPCRSRYLPQEIKQRTEVRQRNNEIMIRMCKIPCKRQIHERYSPTGTMLERVNNTAGFYSLTQELPREPVVGRRTMFAYIGQAIAIRCPGTTLRDVPFTWRVGNKRVIPRYIDSSTDGRIHLNSRDHLVISTVVYQDANLYSCWQRDEMAGTVKLVVWADEQVYYNHHVLLVAMVIAAAIVLHCFLKLMKKLERKYM